MTDAATKFITLADDRIFVDRRDETCYGNTPHTANTDERTCLECGKTTIEYIDGKQAEVVNALVRANWTVTGINEADEVEMTAFAFDGNINKFGWVLETGTTYIQHPGHIHMDVATYSEITGVLV